MNGRPFRIPALGFFLAFVVLLADQATKIALEASRDHLPWRLFGDVRLEYVHNTGASFSLFRGHSWVLVIVVSLVSVALVVALLRAPRPFAAPLGLLLGGSLGNLVDRIRLGHVLDFIGVYWWPTFNVADIGIGFGIAFLILALLRKRPA